MKLLRNVLSIILGCAIGSLVNYGLIMVGPLIIPTPLGFDPMSVESIKETMSLLEPQHFLFPFLGHALGTLAGALAAGIIASSQKKIFAMAVACIFLLGGIANVFMIPAPTSFVVLDLALAYVPMGWLAGRWAAGK